VSHRLDRLRAQALVILQGGVAATAAWAIATEILGHERPLFAPLSAIVAVGTGYGQRARRTVELVLGVALGIGVADLLVSGIGTGIWQLFLVTVLAMVVAVLLTSGQMLVLQAALSAMLVVTLQPPGSGLAGQRFVDALVGGGVALLVGVLLPAHPMREVRRAAEQVLDELASVLTALARALERRDPEEIKAVLLRARAIDGQEHRWREAVDVGYELARSAPRRGVRQDLANYAIAAEQMDLAVRNVRVLSRAVLRAVELGDPVPAGVVDALCDLSRGVRSLGGELADPSMTVASRSQALTAAAQATDALQETQSLSVSVIVGQIRSTAVDLLRGLGDDGPEARSAVREAAPHEPPLK
jgi:uncharacterized membrane protein YgaE (UPF0421/DUF939 family)